MKRLKQQFKTYVALLLTFILTTVPVTTHAASLDPEDKYYYKQWGLFNDGVDVNVLPVWEVYTSAQPIIVAVIDTGIDYEHEDLKDHIWTNSGEIAGNGIDDDGNGYIDDVYGWNFYDNNGITCAYAEGSTRSADASNSDEHGTMVAGTIAASANEIGVRGVASNINVKLMSLKVAGGTQATGKTSNIIKAIRYADSMGASICNISLNSLKYSEELYQTMRESDMLFVCSAGNTKPNGQNIDTDKTYPAAYQLPNLITVAAISSDGSLASYSNYGKAGVSMAAPGTSIYTTAVGDRYVSSSGTSMAAPFVSGISAILLTMRNDLYTAEWKSILESTVKPIASLKNKTKTGGIVDAYASYSKTLTYVHKTDTAAPTITAAASYSKVKKTGTIKVHISDSGSSGLSAVRYASGKKAASAFAHGQNGTRIYDNQISITKTGTYTIYACDHAGNETVKYIKVK